MGATLGPRHADRRQLGDLMATEPPPRAPLLGGERAAAPTARVRVVIDDLIDLILGTELATRTPMPRLPAGLALLALPPRQLLRARSRPTLLPCLRRIHRRRPRARARILPRLSLQASQALLKLLHACSEIKHELHTHLAPRVIDRLRLHALHARKIRCNKQESSPPAPTTERLRLCTLQTPPQDRSLALSPANERDRRSAGGLVGVVGDESRAAA